MADLRELVLEGVMDRLLVDEVDWHGEVTSRPDNLQAHRYFTRQPDARLLPDLTVFWAGELIRQGDETAIEESDRGLRIGIRGRAKAAEGESGDQALIPIMGWAEIALLSDYTIGGLIAEARLEGIDAISSREWADTYAEATAQFEMTLLTAWGDPRQTP